MKRSLLRKFIFAIGIGWSTIALAQTTPIPVATPKNSPTLTPSATPLDTSTPTPIPTPQLPKPLILTPSEKMSDSDYHPFPNPPQKGPDSVSLNILNDDSAPRDPAMVTLGDPAISNQIANFNKTENKVKTYHWHTLNGSDYLHLHSGSGSDWYGWLASNKFHWVLFQFGHFWWHDTYAERWLYYEKGYWWWQGPKKNQFQAYLLDGHYHVCDLNGVLGDDLFTTGTEETVTQPVSKETPLSSQEDDTSPGGGMMNQGNLPSH